MKKILLPTIFLLFFAFTANSQSATVLGDKVKLRSFPSDKGKVIRVLDKNATVSVIRQKGLWTKIRWHKTIGWLRANSINAVKMDMRLDLLTKLGDADMDTGYRAVGSDDSSRARIVVPEGTLPTVGGGGVLNGKATSLPKPVYPAAAKALHAGGSVSVQVLIDENGKVISASAISGHPLLRASAVSAAQGATFSPTLLSGQPVKVSGVIVYNFVP